MATIPFDADDQAEQEAEAEATAEAKAARERKIKAAMNWLQAAMAGQQKPAALMIAQAEAAGIARTTLTTARQRLHIHSQRRADGWHWIPARSRKKQPATA